MKTCSKCKTPKELDEFGKSKRHKGGYIHQCKTCVATIKLARIRTKRGLVITIYDNQKSHSIARGHKPPSYTVDELRDWFRGNPIANKLYRAWKCSGYDKDLVPSVDRLDDDEPYTLDNIQLMTWKENRDKSHSDAKNGINNKRNKSVIKMKLDDSLMDEYHSIAEASRQTGLNNSEICACCNGRQKTSGGFRWKFA